MLAWPTHCYSEVNVPNSGTALIPASAMLGHHAEIINHVVRPYFRFPLSYCDMEEMSPQWALCCPVMTWVPTG